MFKKKSKPVGEIQIDCGCNIETFIFTSVDAFLSTIKNTAGYQELVDYTIFDNPRLEKKVTKLMAMYA